MGERRRRIVLGIAGSPRRDGSTDRLLDAFMSGAGDAGADTEILRISSLRIEPCDGCDGCVEDGICVLKDDFQSVNDRVIAADVLVLAAPLYFAALPARVKALVDRAQCQWVRKYRLHRDLPPSHAGYARRKGILLSSAGDPRADFSGMRRTVRYFFNVYETDYFGELLVRGVDIHGRIPERTLREASALGRKMCMTTDHNTHGPHHRR